MSNSNKVIVNKEATTKVVKVIAAGPQGARGEGFNSVSSSLNTRLDILEDYSGSYTGSFSGAFFGDASGLINIPAAGVVGLQLNQIASGDVTASVSSGGTSFRIFDTKDLLSLDDSGKLWVTGSVSASLIFGQIVSGSELVFGKLSTSQSSDSQLIIGNSFGDYAHKQTTIFKNGDIILSGSLILEAKNNVNPISGGLFYSSSNEFYLGFS